MDEEKDIILLTKDVDVCAVGAGDTAKLRVGILASFDFPTRKNAKSVSIMSVVIGVREVRYAG
jgi:hypothetical protein